VSIIELFEGWLLGWRCAHGEHFRDAARTGGSSPMTTGVAFSQPKPMP
jgi:hypothetical protein